MNCNNKVDADCVKITTVIIFTLSFICMAITGFTLGASAWQFRKSDSCGYYYLGGENACYNCEIHYDVKDEYFNRITFTDSCPGNTVLGEITEKTCWYDVSNHDQVSFNHPVTVMNWFTYLMFLVFLAITSVSGVVAIVLVRNDNVIQGMCGSCKLGREWKETLAWVCLGLSAIGLIAGSYLLSAASIESAKWAKDDDCYVQIKNGTGNCKSCVVKSSRTVLTNSCPELPHMYYGGVATCWYKRNDHDIISFNEPFSVMMYNYKISGIIAIVMGIPFFIWFVTVSVKWFMHNGCRVPN